MSYSLRIISCMFAFTFVCAINGLSEKRLCGDTRCQNPISFGFAIKQYMADKKGKVSFNVASEIKVLSKSADGGDLWYIEVNGQRGYAPKSLIQERKMLIKKENLVEVTVPLKEEPAPSPKTSSNSAGNEEVNVTTTATLDIQRQVEATIPKGSEEESKEEVKTPQSSSVQVEKGREGQPLIMSDTRSQENKNSKSREQIPTDVDLHDESKPSAKVGLTQINNNSMENEKNSELKTEVEDGRGSLEKQNETDTKITSSEGQRKLEEINLRDSTENQTENVSKSTEVPAPYLSNESVVQPQLPQSQKENVEDKFRHQEVPNSGKYEAKSTNSSHDGNWNDTKITEVSHHLNETIVEESEQSNKDIEVPVQVQVLSEENQVKDKEELNNLTDSQSINDVKATETHHIRSESIVNRLMQPQKEGNIEGKFSDRTVLSENGEKFNKPTGHQNQNDTKEEVAQVETSKIPASSNETKESLTVPNSESSVINTQIVNGNNLTNAGKIVASEEENENSDFIANEVQENPPDGNSLSTGNDDEVQNSNKKKPFQSNNVDIRSRVLAVYSEKPTKLGSPPSENLEQKTANDSNIVVVGSRKDVTTNEKNLRDQNSFNSTVKPTAIPNVPFNLTPSHEKANSEIVSAQEDDVEQTPNLNAQTENTQKTFKTQQSLIHDEDQKQDQLKSTTLESSTSSDDAGRTSDTYQTTTTPGTQSELQNFESEDAEQYAAHNVNEINEQLPLNHNNADQNNYRSKEYGHQTADGNTFSNSDKLMEEQTSEKHDVAETDNFYSAQIPPTDTSHITSDADTINTHYQQTTEVNHYEYSTPLFRELHTEPTTPSPVAFTSTSSPSPSETTKQYQEGLFTTILGTVNSFLSNDKNEKVKRNSYNDHTVEHTKENVDEETQEFCEKLTPNSACPKSDSSDSFINPHFASLMNFPWDISKISMQQFTDDAVKSILDMSDMIACLVITAISTLIFIFGYYCFCSNNKESELLSKLNFLERNLLATNKENIIFKHDLMETRNKLSSIEDNSFGSNEMVMSLKKELEAEVAEKQKLQEQVGNLEKELENAAEAGLELNKIVSELLSNQTGDESIISSVEELQKQLNEQQNTILEINTNLAEKSRENSELQLMIAEQHTRLSGEIASLQQDNDELEAEKSNLQTQLEEVKTEFEKDITKALEGKNMEIQRLQVETAELKTNCEEKHAKWQTSLAKIEALEECLKSLKKDSKVNIKEVIDAAHIRAEILDLQKQKMSLKELLEAEKDARNLLEEQVKMFSAEVEKLKHNFHQSEKDKLEAQTRLEVLANYFKEKETQLQKELSLKEAMWLKQQGEKTSTVDRLTSMQAEIQALKSQNDSLRAEIEAQLAAHKAQTGTLENRAHETWLAARQSERRYEEARADATALRRKLTSLAGLSGNEVNDAKLGMEQRNAPSPNAPNQLETPESTLSGRMPPPPPFLPPPFMGPVPPFMGVPPPFIHPGQMRPPPMGRLMSPPPPPGAPTHSNHLRSRRYTPSDHGDFDNYDDDDDDDDDDDENEIPQHTRGGYKWPSPAAGPYRSHSPSESRYSRDAMEPYGFRSETDYSPPPSPRDHHTRGPRSGSFKTYSPPPTASSPISDGGRKGTMSRKKGGRFTQSVFLENTSSDSDSASGNSDVDSKAKRLYKW